MTGSQTSIDFKPPSGYSFETSLPAYEEGRETVKARQQEKILDIVMNGAKTIREIAKRTGLPDSTVAGRVNDLIKDQKLEYDGYAEYDGRKRKQIGLVNSGGNREIT